MNHLPIQILIPMSGQGTRYQNAGYKMPKPLIPVSQVPMISRLLSNFPQNWTVTFVMAKNHKNTDLPELLSQLRPNENQLFIDEHKLGPSHAVLEGLKHINEDSPVLVSYCDYAMVWDARQFERFVQDSECDACLISYRGFHAHYLSPVPYAYSKMDGERVTRVKEKGCFTDNRENEFASCGAYYFKSARLLKEAINFQIENNLQLNGEYYTSLTVQALLQKKPESHVRIFEIPGFFQWGTPEDLQNFEYWERTFKSLNKNVSSKNECSQILMPMAGAGSRFSKLTDVPKPLIPVNRTPMFLAALHSLPAAHTNVFICLEQFRPQISMALHSDSKIQNTKINSLPETPPGQAFSTAEGLNNLDETGDIIISSCDHSIVLDHKKWKEFTNNSNCDAAIFTVKGFPGTRRSPKSFAYVAAHHDDETFQSVKNVSVKIPISENPSLDHLLVGTFWFKNKFILTQGLNALRAKNPLVNNELYLDSIFECLIQLGFKVRIIELDGYINWGDPDSLAEALYWQEMFLGHRIDQRNRFPGVTSNASV